MSYSVCVCVCTVLVKRKFNNYFFIFLKEILYAHQACIYLIKKQGKKTAILLQFKVPFNVVCVYLVFLTCFKTNHV